MMKYKNMKLVFYLATLDLQWAYRSVPIKKDEQTLTGLSWTFMQDNHPTYLADCRLPFGARKALTYSTD